MAPQEAAALLDLEQEEFDVLVDVGVPTIEHGLGIRGV